MSRKNNSYSTELKYRAVEDYLEGEASLWEICKKYKIRSTHQPRDWIRLIKLFGKIPMLIHCFTVTRVSSTLAESFTSGCWMLE